MRINLLLSRLENRIPETESIFKKVILGCCFSAAGALFLVFWSTAFAYSPYWLVVITMLGVFIGGLSQYNNTVGRIFNEMLWMWWAVSPVSYRWHAPSGMVVLGAILVGLFATFVAALIILCENFFWLEMSKHANAALPRLTSGAVVGLVIYLFRMKILSMAKKSWISISDEFVGAAKKNDIDRLSMLLAGGANINAKEIKTDFTALIAASFYGRIETVRFLIARGAKVNKREKVGNSTPLLIAAQQGHAGIVNMLITAGAEINQTNDNGLSAIGSAAGNGHTEIVRLLLSEGAEVNTKP